MIFSAHWIAPQPSTLCGDWSDSRRCRSCFEMPDDKDADDDAWHALHRASASNIDLNLSLLEYTLSDSRGPAFRAGEGTPHALIIVPVAGHTEEGHTSAETRRGNSQ